MVTAEIAEMVEAEAMADLYAAAPPDCAADTGLATGRVGAAYQFLLPALDHALFNRVIGLGVAEAASEEDIDVSLDTFAAAGVRNGAIQLSPAARPDDLPAWLARRGLQPGLRWA